MYPAIPVLLPKPAPSTTSSASPTPPTAAPLLYGYCPQLDLRVSQCFPTPVPACTRRLYRLHRPRVAKSACAATHDRSDHAEKSGSHPISLAVGHLGCRHREHSTCACALHLRSSEQRERERALAHCAGRSAYKSESKRSTAS